MQPGPLVSIVTPVLNGVRYIGETLASVRNQDYPRIEHIVVDGGSTDGTLELLRQTPGIAWVSQPDGGMYHAINRGFEMARGDLLAYQNADDRYAPLAVSTAVNFLVEHPETDVVYGGFRMIDEAGRPIEGRVVRPRPFDSSAVLCYNFVPGHSTFVRRSVVVQDNHWFNPALQFAGDWDWVVGMSRAGKRFGTIDAVLSEFRRHLRSKTSTLASWRKIAEWHSICRKHQASLVRLLWYEHFYMPLRRRLGLWPYASGSVRPPAAIERDLEVRP